MTTGNNLLRTLTKLLAEHPPAGAGRFEAAQVEQLLEVYYRHISADDLDEHEPNDLLGALIAHWRLMRQRMPEEALVRVYNPEQEEDGWRSGDTIVEVVARDMPFLVDSLLVELNRLGLTVRFTIHPVFAAVRDNKGMLLGLGDPRSADSEHAIDEAVIQLHVDRQPQTRLVDLQHAIANVIDAVAQTNADWPNMRRLAQQIEEDLCEGRPGRPCADLNEARELIQWMINDHFLFIAACAFRLEAVDGIESLVFDPGSGLGQLGDEGASERASDWVSGLEAGLSGDDVELMRMHVRLFIVRPTWTVSLSSSVIGRVR